MSGTSGKKNGVGISFEELYEKLHETPIADEAKRTLIEKCQENGWLMRGGYAWQDDPYLEDYPYEFAQVRDIDTLRHFFAHGNWAIRQGVVYDDLAFVQQVDGGDEWWTLKKTEDGYLDFESISFRFFTKDEHEFSRFITSMQMATPEQCRHLEYTLKEDGPTWACVVDDDEKRMYLAETEGIVLTIEERPDGTFSSIGKEANPPYKTIATEKTQDPLSAARLLEEQVSILRQEESGLVQRARQTREASDVLDVKEHERETPAKER